MIALGVSTLLNDIQDACSTDFLDMHFLFHQSFELAAACLVYFLTRGLFLESPVNLTGPKSYFEIQFSRKVGCVLTSNEVHFVSLADNFTVPFSNLLNLLSRMKNKTA